MAHIGTKLFGLLVVGAALLGGCSVMTGGDTSSEPATAISTDSQAIVEGTPEAYGVVGLVNDPKTDFHVLDELVPLDKRAARNLIAHRNGPDGVLGTADDDLFDNVTEVDDVKYVGPVALESLLAYAEAQGYVPTGDDVLGVYDDVAFTVDEAAATLELVNTASYDTLDIDVALDKRAVDSIMAARNVESMLQLEELYFVGHSAMLKLRDYPKTAPAPAPDPTGTTPNGMECDAYSDCQSGFCAGLLVPWLSRGLCMAPSTAGTFTSTTPIAITDDGNPIESTIPVSGLATVPLDVVVDLDIDHPRKQDLVVVLHQPGGAEAVLWDHEQNPPSHIVAPPGIESDNMVNGDWVLEITDTVTGESGTLNSWKMWLSSNYD